MSHFFSYYLRNVIDLIILYKFVLWDIAQHGNCDYWYEGIIDMSIKIIWLTMASGLFACTEKALVVDKSFAEALSHIEITDERLDLDLMRRLEIPVLQKTIADLLQQVRLLLERHK